MQCAQATKHARPRLENRRSRNADASSPAAESTDSASREVRGGEPTRLAAVGLANLIDESSELTRYNPNPCVSPISTPWPRKPTHGADRKGCGRRMRRPDSFCRRCHMHLRAFRPILALVRRALRCHSTSGDGTSSVVRDAQSEDLCVAVFRLSWMTSLGVAQQVLTSRRGGRMASQGTPDQGEIGRKARKCMWHRRQSVGRRIACRTPYDLRHGLACGATALLIGLTQGFGLYLVSSTCRRSRFARRYCCEAELAHTRTSRLRCRRLCCW